MAAATLQLNTGAAIPAMGFGTWQDKDEQYDAVIACLKAGYRHIDTARVYGTEGAVGKAVRDSGIPRNQIFVTTKLWSNSHHPDDVGPAMEASLKDLGLDYIDLYLMHWPAAFKRGDELFPKDADGKPATLDIDYVDTWKAMEKLPKEKVKAIGISNFNQSEIERILKEGSIIPAAHQLELHPWLQQQEFVEWNKSNGIHITAYSPFGNLNAFYGAQHLGKLIDDPVLVEVGKKHGKSGAQAALAWAISRGHSVVPKSKTPSRIENNFQGDFPLEEEDLKKIATIDKKLRFNDASKDFGYSFFVGLDGK